MVTAVDTASSASSYASSSASALATDFDMFLQLLTTQLQNQDPTNPMDPNQFTEQLVQFSQVEQQININRNLEAMMAMMQTQQSSANLGYIGKVVDVNSDQVSLVEGGSAYWSYELPSGVTSVQYDIVDENGNVVRSVTAAPDDSGDFPSGRIEVSWDGLDDNGNPVPAGTYRLEVTAKNSQGQVMDGVNVYVRGYVEGVETVDGEQFLVVSGSRIRPEDVVAVYELPEGDDGGDEETA